MRARRALVVTAAGLAMWAFQAQPARAQTVMQHHAYHAAAGEPITVFKFARTDRRCLPSGQPLITLTGGPDHGTITMAHGTHIVQESVGSAQCNGREVADLHVFYTPAPGFQGVDRFRLHVRFGDALILKDVKVTVE